MTLGPKKKPARVAAKLPDPLAKQDPFTGGRAPPYLQGIRPLDTQKMLSEASPDQLKFLTHSSFSLWAQYSGLEVDGRPFDFDSRRWLLPIYLDQNDEMVWIKAAQMGATIYMLLRLLWYAMHNQVKCGLFFPTADGVNKLSKDRLQPLIDSNAEMKAAMNSATDSLGVKQIQNLQGRISSLYMLYLGGQASKDSVPLDVVGFDEVRLVNSADIDQALERISASQLGVQMYVSTAGYPNMDIHKRFLRGSQLVWHIKCNCLDGFVPSDCFPDCICDTGKEVYIRCPKCKMRINDTQNGNYVALNPGAKFNSYHVSQFMSKSKRTTPAKIWEAYQTTTNMKEFWNAKLGKPYVDEENVPINDAVLENCINTELRWANNQGAHKDLKKNCAMGVDQHSGNVFVVISKPGPDGKKQIVHLEYVETANPNYWENGKPVTPFKRVHQLMKEFDIGMCLIDAMPNANEAADLARDFPGRVFLVWYGDGGQDMVNWHDRVKHKEAVKKGSTSIKVKWQVTLNRYLSIEFALKQFTDRSVEFAHPDALLQVAKNKVTGRFETEAICRARFWPHLRGIIRQKTITDELTGKFKMEWVYLGFDPHFVHAWNYCNVAMERLRRRAIFVM